MTLYELIPYEVYDGGVCVYDVILYEVYDGGVCVYDVILYEVCELYEVILYHKLYDWSRVQGVLEICVFVSRHFKKPILRFTSAVFCICFQSLGVYCGVQLTITPL